MTTAEIPHEPKSKAFGIISVTAAFLALLSVLVGPAIRDAITPPPPAEKQLAEVVVGIKERIAAKIKNTPVLPEAPRQRFSPQQLPYTLSLALAALAIIGGAISYLRREDRRYAYVACGIGAATLAWHALVLALAAVILCVIIHRILPDVLS